MGLSGLSVLMWMSGDDRRGSACDDRPSTRSERQRSRDEPGTADSVHFENFGEVLSDKKLFRSFFNSAYLRVYRALSTSCPRWRRSGFPEPFQFKPFHLHHFLSLVAPSTTSYGAGTCRFSASQTSQGAIMLYTAQFLRHGVIYYGFVSQYPERWTKPR
jgi:hypothetical protein